MSKRIIGLLFIFVSIWLYGCMGGVGKDPKAGEIQDKIINMESYACQARVSRIDNEKINIYETQQVYQMDGQYKVEVISPDNLTGLITICDGQQIVQYNSKLDQSKLTPLSPNNFRNQMFLGTFVQNYLQSEDVSIEVQNIEESLTTVLEAVIPGGSEHMSIQRVWIDQKTSKPVQMSIYNKDNKETVKIEFLEFTYNPKIDPSIFTVD